MILTIIGTVLAALQFIIAAAGAGVMNYDNYFEAGNCDEVKAEANSVAAYGYYVDCREVIHVCSSGWMIVASPNLIITTIIITTTNW